MIILQYYHKSYHENHESVINEIRQKYWIVGLRQELRYFVNNCVICKIHRGKPLNPKITELPPIRLGYRLRHFTSTSLDYLGPMEVKIGRRRGKRYGFFLHLYEHESSPYRISTES